MEIGADAWGKREEFDADHTALDAKLNILNSKTKPYDWAPKSDSFTETALLTHLNRICKLTATKMRLLSFTGALPGNTVDVFVPMINTETDCTRMARMFTANMAAHGFMIDEFYLMHRVVNKGCELEY